MVASSGGRRDWLAFRDAEVAHRKRNTDRKGRG